MVEAGQDGAIRVVRVAAAQRPTWPQFVRQMPSRASRAATNPKSQPPNTKSIRYRLTDLGTLGGRSSIALAVNDAGQVVGQSDTAAGVKHAFLYDGRKLKDLGVLGGTTGLGH